MISKRGPQPVACSDAFKDAFRPTCLKHKSGIAGYALRFWFRDGKLVFRSRHTADSTPQYRVRRNMGWMIDLMKEIPLSAALKERLAHEEKLHEETKARNVELRLQVDELTKTVAKLTAELATSKVIDEFDERGGLLWRKGTGAGPFCPKCKGTMGRFWAASSLSQMQPGCVKSRRIPTPADVSGLRAQSA